MWNTELPPGLYASLFVSWRRVRKEADLLDRIFRAHGAKRLVEFGCGVGRHGYEMSKRGYEVLLTDVRDWRHGAPRRLPFMIYDVTKGAPLDGGFDGGYAMGLLVVLSDEDIRRALKNIRDALRGGIFVFDYNFVVHGEPRKREVKLAGRRYVATLVKEEIERRGEGVAYRYRIEVRDESGRLVGVEDSSYTIYDQRVLFEAIKEAGLEIVSLRWLSWDRDRYEYSLRGKRGDSVIIAVKTGGPHRDH